MDSNIEISREIRTLFSEIQKEVAGLTSALEATQKLLEAQQLAQGDTESKDKPQGESVIPWGSLLSWRVLLVALLLVGLLTGYLTWEEVTAWMVRLAIPVG